MSEQQQAQGRARGRGRINVQQPNMPGRQLERPPLVSESSAPKRSAFEQGDSSNAPRAPGPAYQGAGRATLHRVQEPAPGTSGGGNGGGAPAAAAGGDSQRGAMRGRRMIYDIVRTRPPALASKKGTTGSICMLQANYFRLLKKPTWSLYQYRVDFSPDIEVLSVRKGLLKGHRELLGGNIFDGSTLFLTNRLQSDLVELQSKNRLDEVIQLKIKFTGLVSMNEGSSVQILNIIMRKALEGLQLELIGRNFFDPIARVRINEFNLELWPGYVTSIRQHEQDILMCAEISHKVMRTDTVLDILSKCIQQTRGDYKEAFQKAVIGMIVLTDYNNKFYRIDDVDFNQTPEITFQTKNGPVSFIDYYKTKYNINIRDRRQPLLISKAKARDIRAGQSETISLIPELSRATGITEEMRTNFQLMKAMGQYTKVGPDIRIQKLMAFNNRLRGTPASEAVFQEWQMQLDTNLVEVSGRELRNENIVYGCGVKIPTDRNADWTSQLKSQKLFMAAEINNWFLVSPERNMREAQDFVKCMQDAGRGMAVRIGNPQVIPLNDDRAQTYISALEHCANKDAQLIMCVAPNNRAERYSAIKKKCCVDRAIPTQVMLVKTITPKRGQNARSLMSVATKVAIQLNCKLGFAPWTIELPLSGLMTIGFDVCHDSTNKAKSYGALVATMDLKTCGSYFSAVSAHKNGEELSNEMALNVTKALKEFRRLHNALPSKIVFYRDGVGEGQLQFVVDHEIQMIKEKLTSIYKTAGVERGYNMAFIVVNKRINTRFFNRRQNPTPGTVIDDIVTAPESYDFYLISQSSRQGTVSPTYYNIISDNLGLPADKIQILTYKQCHLYYNWPGTTRVPAVCQYAHKLAFLVGQSIHQSPSNLLEQKLYFL